MSMSYTPQNAYYQGQGGGPVFVSGVPVPNIANVNDLKPFQVFWDQWEALKQSLYDSASYAAAGVSQLTFFLAPIGSGTGFGGAAKTASDTNMTLAGQIPNNQMFLVQGVEVEFQPTTPNVTAQMPAVFGAQAVAQIVNDSWIFYRSGNIAFTIGAKSYLQEAPLMKLPPSSVFEVQGAAADISTTGANMQTRIAFAGARGAPYILAPYNLMIPANTNFSVSLNWPEGVQAITNPGRIFVRLVGYLFRKAQ